MRGWTRLHTLKKKEKKNKTEQTKKTELQTGRLETDAAERNPVRGIRFSFKTKNFL